MKAKEFDQKFEAEEDLTPYLDLSKAKRLESDYQSIRIDLPIWLLERINQEANRLGTTPQEVIQTSLAKYLAVNRPQ
ncbi:MAG: CopG family transcriptional regulator [Cyanobacteria bacterium P01_H01_bin.26]